MYIAIRSRFGGILLCFFSTKLIFRNRSCLNQSDIQFSCTALGGFPELWVAFLLLFGCFSLMLFLILFGTRDPSCYYSTLHLLLWCSSSLTGAWQAGVLPSVPPGLQEVWKYLCRAVRTTTLLWAGFAFLPSGPFS